MTQHFYYFSPQTPGADRWTVDLGTSAIRLGDIPGWATAAENGDAASNGVAIDDPTGNAGYFGDGILGLKTFYVTEDYCAPYGADGVNGTRLWTGYIGQRRYRRGNQSPSTSLLTGAARRIDISLEDLNSLASFRIIGDPSGVRDAAHGNRPAETDVQRIQWLIGTVYLPVTNDAGWIDTSGPVNMDANDYTGASAADVVHDCATASGKDWWIGYWEATGTDSLWYAKSASSTAYTSLLSLTDDIADLTLLSNGEIDPASTVWPVMPDAELLRDPTFTYSGLYEPYDSGYIIAQLATTANTYAWRDGTAPNANVKTAAKANAIATRLLNQDSTEQDRITCRVQLPASLATGIKAGQRLQFRSTFMTFASGRSYENWTWMRVKRCTVAQDEETDGRYTFSLELTPQVSVCSATLVQSAAVSEGADLILGAPVTAGSLLVYAAAHQDDYPGPPILTGTWTLVESVTANSASTSGFGRVWWKIATGTEGAQFNVLPADEKSRAAWIAEYSTGDCTASVDTTTSDLDNPGGGGYGFAFTGSGTITPAAGPKLLLAFFVASNGQTPAVAPWTNLSPGWTSLTAQWQGHQLDGTARVQGLLASRYVLDPTSAYPVSADSICGCCGDPNTAWGSGLVSFILS